MMKRKLKTGELGHKAGSPLFFSPAKSSQLQIPSSREVPNPNTFELGFDVWNFGAWNLELFPPSHA
jgi:hypothetical protein